MEPGGWDCFDLARLLEKKDAMTFPYLEFLRTSSFSCGLYSLPAGARDLQGPHDEDEIYFVIRGKALLRIGDEEQPVTRGSIVYVPATEEHRFVEIEEDVTLLVVFGTPGREKSGPAPREAPSSG